MSADDVGAAGLVVGDTGLEPVTSSVSGKRASQTAPIALGDAGLLRVSRRERESNPRTGLCRPLPKPLGHPARNSHSRADDGIRTRDPHLGKVMRYQLRYVRASEPWRGPAMPAHDTGGSGSPTVRM